MDVASTPAVEVIILEGAAIVNMLKPGTSRTFSEYAPKVFLPYISKQLQSVQRLDLIWDEYVKGNLKRHTRPVPGEKVVVGV